MAAILNCVILDSAIFEFVFPLKLTLAKIGSHHLNKKKLHSHFPPHHLHKKLHSFILTQIDECSYLEFCHAGFSHSHLGFRHLVILPQIHSKHSHSTLTLTQTNAIWLKLIHCPLAWWWQPILNSAILDSAILNSSILDLAILHKKLHSFILTHLDDGSHLEFCHLGFRHLVIFSQIHSKTLSLHSDSDSF